MELVLHVRFSGKKTGHLSTVSAKLFSFFFAVDSLETFGEVIGALKVSQTFRNKSLIVLLNKEDSFAEKLQSDPLENYFTKFQPTRSADPKEAREYIKHLFHQVARKQGFDVTRLDVKFTSAIDKKFGDKIIHSLLRSIVVQIFS